jgi:hypothetical protein
MRMKASKLSGLIFLLIIIKLIASCTPESCIGETTSFVNATFYKRDPYKPLAPDSITVFGIGKETNKLYSKSIKPLSIKLPLNASLGTCGFVIKINGTTDTLNFDYSAYPHLISKECGITFFYTLSPPRIFGSAIDSVILVNENITTFSNENIRILY